MAINKSSKIKTQTSKTETNLLTISPEDAKQELKEMIKRNSLHHRDAVLKSGRITSVYFDLKETILGARGSFLAAICLLNMLKPNVAALGGSLESSFSIPVSISMLSNISGKTLDTFYVKKEGDAKTFGKSKMIEGPLRPGTKVCIIQDLVTSGTHIIEMSRRLKDALDIEVVQVLTLMERHDGAVYRMDELGIEYNYLFSVKEFVHEEIYSNV